MRTFIFHNRLSNLVERVSLLGWQEAHARLATIKQERFIEVHLLQSNRIVSSSTLNLEHPFYDGANLFPSKYVPLSHR